MLYDCVIKLDSIENAVSIHTKIYSFDSSLLNVSTNVNQRKITVIHHGAKIDRIEKSFATLTELYKEI